METSLPEGIESFLAQTGIKITSAANGIRVVSDRGRFTGFTITSTFQGAVYNSRSPDSTVIHRLFPGAACQLAFSGGSRLMTYASGHIRWVTNEGMDYYRQLSQEQPPVMTQGDLVLFSLEESGRPSRLDRLSDMLPEDQRTVWCHASPPINGIKVGWHTADKIALGGNGRHQAAGRLKWLPAVAGDNRTMQMVAVSDVTVFHDPVDDIHPTLTVPAGSHLLVTKLPGFSNPAEEMLKCPEVLL